MKFKTFLNEKHDEFDNNHTTKISLQKSALIYLEKCKEYDKKIGFYTRQGIWRGQPHIHDFSVVNGQKHKRDSLNTNKIYSRIIDSNIDKLNKNYPKRSSSLFLTTNKDYTDEFGERHLAIPFDDAMIGYMNVLDIWNVTLEMFGKRKSIKNWNEFFEDHGISDDINSADDLIKQIEDICKIKKPNTNQLMIYNMVNPFNDYSLEYTRYNVREEIENAYSLKNLGLFISTIDDMVFRGNKEMFTNGKVLLIAESKIDMFIDEVQELKHNKQLKLDFD